MESYPLNVISNYFNYFSKSFVTVAIELLAQIGTPAEEDLVSWAHHSDSSTIPDVILRAASSGQVFIASNNVSRWLFSGNSRKVLHFIACLN